jgi:hypothetical protein
MGRFGNLPMQDSMNDMVQQLIGNGYFTKA